MKERTDISKIVDKIKDSAGVVGEKVSEGTGQAVQFIQKKAEKIIKNPNVGATKHPQSTHEKEEPKVKLDDELRKAVTEYNDAYTTMYSNGDILCVMRTRAVDLILNVETLINSIANRPKSFDTDIAEIQTQRVRFIDVCEFAKAELEAAKKSALGAGAGISAGAAIVSVAPTAAMWVATTFGTASTGTAISALSGAAATNAALAWLGGGAVAAGGGGMAAGHAFLALAGPVGWTIASATLLASITLFTINKFKLSKQKKEEIEAIKQNTHETLIISEKIKVFIDETTMLRDQLNQMYGDSLHEFGKDFMSLSEERQLQLGALVNNTKALAFSLGKSIE